MTFAKKNPRAGARSGVKITRVPAYKTRSSKNSRHAFLSQLLSFLTSGVFSLFGTFIDLRVLAFAVRVAVRREEVRHG